METLLLIVIFINILLVTYSVGGAASGYAILEVRPAGQVKASNKMSVCVAYNSEYQNLPSDIEHAKFHLLVDLSQVEGCTIHDFSKHSASLENRTVAVKRGNCTFTEKAYMAQLANASAILVVDYKNSTRLTYPGGNGSEFQSLNITLATVIFDVYMSVINMSESVEVAMYAPSSPLWDANMILIIIFSTVIVVIGGAWAAYDEWQFTRRSRDKTLKKPHGIAQDEEDVKAREDEPEISVLSIIIWFILICGIILLLYFFYDYMVYFFIAMFCIMGSYSLYKCLLPLWSLILPITYSIPVNKLPCIQSKVKLRSFLLLLLCLTVGIFWAIERHAKYAWTLQDLLGAAFCVYFIHSLRLPNLKVISVLLVLLLVYDVFFVFITPLFTSDGNSIMESVATGGRGHSKESLPMVFLLPTLLDSPLRRCMNHEFSLLGFGDVIIPGLLVAYNSVFDIKTGSRMVYFICSSLGYFVGMIICIVSLLFMNSGQPALLYLVPGTLLTTIIVAAVRKELRSLFLGIHKQQPKPSDNIESQTGENEEEELNSTDGLAEEQRNLIN